MNSSLAFIDDDKNENFCSFHWTVHLKVGTIENNKYFTFKWSGFILSERATEWDSLHSQ